MSIAAAELVYEGHVMDEYRVTMSLHNRIGVPVTLSQIGSVAITSVRADGAEMGAGFVHIPQTYEVLPGKTTFVLDSDTTTYHGFGSPVTSFKLDGTVGVMNSYPDQLARVKFCDYRDMEMGPPLTGYWGS